MQENAEMRSYILGVLCTPGSRARISAVLGLKPGDTRVIAEFLKRSSVVKSLSFHNLKGPAEENNRIGDEGGRALGDALKINTSLTALDLMMRSTIPIDSVLMYLCG